MRAAAGVIAAALALASGSVLAQTIALRGADGQSARLTAAEIAAMPHVTTAFTIEGKSRTFSGVPLAALLARVGAPSGPGLRGKDLRDVVIVSAADGYAAVLTLAETDPAFRKEQVMLADREDGAPLPPNEGPFRIVIQGDLRGARMVRRVTGLELRRLEAR